MKRLTLAALLTVALAVTVSAQPQHGDLVVTAGSMTTILAQGYTAYLNPGSPGTLTTLSIHGLGHWVRMAADNSDLVVSEVLNNPAANYLLHVHRGGGNTRRATLGNVTVHGFDLDEDGWIACAQALVPRQSSLLRVTSGTLSPSTTLWTRSLNVLVSEMAIDRDPPTAAPYVLVISGRFGPSSSTWGVVLRADRSGNLTSILPNPPSPFKRFQCIEVHPRSGHFLLLENAASGPAGLLRMNKSCTTVTTLLKGLTAQALKITQDDRAWIAATVPNRLIEYDLTTSTPLRTLVYPGPSSLALRGIEVYGSRSLVCAHQPMAPTVSVTVKSQQTWAPGASYALAASLARRPPQPIPPFRFPNGDYLDLDVTGPLFLLSAQNLLPGTFKGFRGTLGASGSASASIVIPGPLLGSGIPIFVAGVLYSSAGLQVTNTHWFVM